MGMFWYPNQVFARYLPRLISLRVQRPLYGGVFLLGPLMSLSNIFKTGADKSLACALVDDLAANISPVLMAERRTSLSVNKITRLLEKSFKAAVEYQQNNGMGYLRRVMFLHAFRSELEDKKYPDDFVQMAVEGMVVALSAKK